MSHRHTESFKPEGSEVQSRPWIKGRIAQRPCMGQGELFIVEAGLPINRHR